jgi:hypothetical protein
MKYYVFGYDPGGDDKHGIAVLEVRKNGKKWRPHKLILGECKTVSCVIAEVTSIISDGEIVATGIDTLTAWSMESAGWRPADHQLRRYKAVAKSVDNPNHINGSMCINGALILRWLSRRPDAGGMITEAHPKVCFYALSKQKYRHPWAAPSTKTTANGRRTKIPPANKISAKRKLLAWLGLKTFSPSKIPDERDHCFDAMLGCLAALKGLNNEWTLDLHQGEDVVHPFFREKNPTHYWWPSPIPKAE